MVDEKYMKAFVIVRMIPVGLAIVGVVSLCVLFGGDPAAGLTERLPGADTAAQPLVDANEPVKLRGELVRFDGVPADLPGAWPRFRGVNFDAVSSEDVTLARAWAEDGPKVLWSIEVGEGYAGAAILAGRVYVMDYDRQNQADAIRCLSLEDGKEIWRYSYPVKVKRFHGMSRTVPAVTEKYIVTLGPKCHVTCLDSMTGQFRWMLNLVKEFNSTVPDWYAGQCPLIDDGRAIIAVGGGALMIAVNCETGEIIWQSPNPHGWAMTHSSIIPAEFRDRRMYVYCASGGVVGVSADDADNGRILWETTEWKIRIANVPSPVVVGEGLIFLSGGYNAGSMMLRLTQENENIRAEPVFHLEPEVFGSEQQTPIFYDGYIYGIRPDKQLTCLDLNGQVVWTSTSTHKFGLGPYIIANGLIYVMNNSGVLTLAEANPAGYVQRASAKVLDGPDSWGPMAIASGCLVLRDLNQMICLDITEQ